LEGAHVLRPAVAAACGAPSRLKCGEHGEFTASCSRQ